MPDQKFSPVKVADRLIGAALKLRTADLDNPAEISAPLRIEQLAKEVSPTPDRKQKLLKACR